MVSIQNVLDNSAVQVRAEQKIGRRRIVRQLNRRQPVGPQVLAQRMSFRDRGGMIGATISKVSPNLPKKRKVVAQINTRKFGE